MLFLGTLVNAAAVIAGSLIGLWLRHRFPDKIRSIVFQGIGLTTLIIGIQMALRTDNILLLIFSVLIGGMIGQAINLEDRILHLGEYLKKRLHSGDERLMEGLVSAFLIFCIGSMTVIGSLDEGLRGDHSLLFAKSILDGFTSIALASTFGIGVLVSVIPLILFQAGITALAVTAQPLFTDSLINSLTAAGGILVLGLGLNLLEIKTIRIINLLPALAVAFLLALMTLRMPLW